MKIDILADKLQVIFKSKLQLNSIKKIYIYTHLHRKYDHNLSICVCACAIYIVLIAKACVTEIFTYFFSKRENWKFSLLGTHFLFHFEMVSVIINFNETIFFQESLFSTKHNVSTASKIKRRSFHLFWVERVALLLIVFMNLTNFIKTREAQIR